MMIGRRGLRRDGQQLADLLDAIFCQWRAIRGYEGKLSKEIMLSPIKKHTVLIVESKVIS